MKKYILLDSIISLNRNTSAFQHCDFFVFFLNVSQKRKRHISHTFRLHKIPSPFFKMQKKTVENLITLLSFLYVLNFKINRCCAYVTLPKQRHPLQRPILQQRPATCCCCNLFLASFQTSSCLTSLIRPSFQTSLIQSS